MKVRLLKIFGPSKLNGLGLAMGFYSRRTVMLSAVADRMLPSPFRSRFASESVGSVTVCDEKGFMLGVLV